MIVENNEIAVVRAAACRTIGGTPSATRVAAAAKRTTKPAAARTLDIGARFGGRTWTVRNGIAARSWSAALVVAAVRLPRQVGSARAAVASEAAVSMVMAAVRRALVVLVEPVMLVAESGRRPNAAGIATHARRTARTMPILRARGTGEGRGWLSVMAQHRG